MKPTNKFRILRSHSGIFSRMQDRHLKQSKSHNSLVKPTVDDSQTLTKRTPQI